MGPVLILVKKARIARCKTDEGTRYL